MTENCRTELLSDYIDDDLEPGTRRTVEEHLTQCASCQVLVVGLRNVVRRAGAFEHGGPPHDLWPGIAARIGAKTESQPIEMSARGLRRLRVSFSVPQLLAASIAMLTLLGTAGWLGARLNRAERSPAIVAMEGPSDGVLLSPVSFETMYDGAVTELMATLEREREWLDPKTVRVVEENLLVIDGAIQRAREALLQDPESEYVRDHLEQTVRQKLGLLRRVTEMVSRI